MADGKTREIRAPEQDRFKFNEFLELISKRGLEKGTYLMDVSGDGQVKLSRYKKYWVQRNELLTEEKDQ